MDKPSISGRRLVLIFGSGEMRPMLCATFLWIWCLDS
jgi:hypothetical protein